MEKCMSEPRRQKVQLVSCRPDFPSDRKSRSYNFGSFHSPGVGGFWGRSEGILSRKEHAQVTSVQFFAKLRIDTEYAASPCSRPARVAACVRRATRLLRLIQGRIARAAPAAKAAMCRCVGRSESPPSP